MSTEKRNPQAEQLANDVVKALEDETARLRKLTADFIADFVRRRIVAALTHQRNHVIVQKCDIPAGVTFDLVHKQLCELGFDASLATTSDEYQDPQVIVYDVAAWVAFHRTPVK